MSLFRPTLVDRFSYKSNNTYTRAPPLLSKSKLIFKCLRWRRPVSNYYTHAAIRSHRVPPMQNNKHQARARLIVSSHRRTRLFIDTRNVRADRYYCRNFVCLPFFISPVNIYIYIVRWRTNCFRNMCPMEDRRKQSVSRTLVFILFYRRVNNRMCEKRDESKRNTDTLSESPGRHLRIASASSIIITAERY